MRRIVAKETLDTDGQCPNAGKDIVGARRVCESETCASFAFEFLFSFLGPKGLLVFSSPLFNIEVPVKNKHTDIELGARAFIPTIFYCLCLLMSWTYKHTQSKSYLISEQETHIYIR